VHLLSSKAARNATFEVKSTVPFSEPWTGPPEDASGDSGTPETTDWEALLSRADLQPGVTGKTINGEYSGTRAEADVARASVRGTETVAA
jgi:hypothetical protein